MIKIGLLIGVPVVTSGRIECGDALDVLRTLPDESVQCCITSPPYWGLRDYGVTGQLGLEKTPAEYVAKMVEVFREVRRVLRGDGVLFLNLGDSYAGGGNDRGINEDTLSDKQRSNRASHGIPQNVGCIVPEGLKAKDLCGIPWRVAFALQQPYRDWQIKTEAMRAWVGGIVDGEGCITILETKSSHSESLSYPPIIQVRMCDLEPLDRLVQVVGSSYGKSQHPPSQVAANQRPSWQWKVVSEQAANVIAEIYPFLTCKRKQAIVAWNHQAFRSARGNQARGRGDIEKEQFCKTLINSLNQREPVDIPSWMKEPEVVYTPGWYLRQDLIWHKPNPMPESVTDRCTKAHEYVFLMAKSERYYYDQEAIKEPAAPSSIERLNQPTLVSQAGSDRVPFKTNGPMKAVGCENGNRNRRSVWTIPTFAFSEAHFATFPVDLIKPMVMAGSKPGDVVLDPFMGAGTVALVAKELGRKYVGIELNPEYIVMANKRLRQEVMPLA